MSLKKKILSAVLAGGLFFSAGNFVADAADSLLQFKEAYLAEITNNRSFSVNADFFGPTYRAEINAKALVLRDATARVNGQINWEYTSPDSQVITENMPFYVAQNGDNMTLYVQRNGGWSSLALPAIPVGIANALKTTDINILQNNMTAIKSVEILKDDSAQRNMNITLDGKKLAELVHQYNDSKATTQDDKDFIAHLADALQTTDVICAWTVQKSTWQTISATLDLTDVIRAYGKDYLDDAAKGEITLTPTDRAFYESLGYYSELHFVATYEDLVEGSIQPPAGINSARSNANVFSDLVQKIGATRK